MLSNNRYNTYQSPLSERYASKEMCSVFSDQYKFSTWRRLWIALAEAQRELGLRTITHDQIEEMRQFQDTINFDVARAYEKKLRHDVMSHIHAYGEQCPKARPIIHLGATSAYVQDNTDLIQMKEGLRIIFTKLINIINILSTQAVRYKDLATLSFTHFQPAQPTTLGKRMCLWIQDYLLDIEEVDMRIKGLWFHGVKGTTGTQASFLSLFQNDAEKVKKLEELVTRKMGFENHYPVTGQTYSRKIDSQIAFSLAGIAQSSQKFSNDMRLLQHMKEVEEPFEEEQIGSSAMAYKRNPMRCERIAALARYVLCNCLNPAFTAASQWFERTLDDSANKRIAVPEAFLAVDGILNIVLNVAAGLSVYPSVINRHLTDELPFMITENILMEAVNAGGDRQELHERIRLHAMESVRSMKEEGNKNDLLTRIEHDPFFSQIKQKLKEITEPKNLVGRAPQQVDDFMKQSINPLLKRYSHLLDKKLIPALHV
ncbi:adenylosuccinate lyase [Candidatus Brocadia sapporoensis]|uniref:Adenylosuccinate lyase n=1 Tax=Candidatus Brocadia sapporoensis TaxID=392547 RepID=A0A1V6LXJ9_9BACT|nr:adenylosuccinate lyase [Candidatus Brocadia sapporoensis]MDG6005959.1 adenylosuccinate lyase [Candidatus Brocadia sp.]OQD44846.1 adenylosuccinate lyase [Candidatus Brocadia sapporoensis]GJQ23010.1 MAG: adenylosuccinate lyase [Candidatus Brocadia sapporoensis]